MNVSDFIVNNYLFTTNGIRPWLASWFCRGVYAHGGLSGGIDSRKNNYT
ncbi:hypothetical protein LSI01_05270 [Furfurilactobacillus siliginis]|uniref:Uncharacterized protein n=1 Tax=Furfurilactobacillus siliginis TaxID=348151 RepID=A0A510VN44_9LACO|nr:hypothetical protein LSI01_05270 [Furfurilactobacillus siliginis]